MKRSVFCVKLCSLLRKCSLKLKLFWDCLRSREMDRISALPEPILQHILSFLPFKQAAQTCLVSKKWEKAWRTLPVLNFDESVFTLELCDYVLGCKEKVLEIRRKRKKLCDRMEKILKYRQREFISIEKFSIDMTISNHQELVSFIDRCACYAIESNVKELKLEFSTWGEWYNVPGKLFCANSIVNMELKACKLELVTINNVKLNSLRKLCLIHLETEDHVVENLLGGCPLIENLTLDASKGFKVLELFNLGKLNKIKLRNNYELERVEINALNVHFIELDGLRDGCEINLSSCQNLKSLKLRELLVTDQWLYTRVSELPLLEYLCITYCRRLQFINILSPRLKTLSIDSCIKLFEIKTKTPNLRSFRYGGEVISFSSNASEFSETYLYVNNYERMDIPWYAKYIEFLAKFNGLSLVLNLLNHLGEDVIIPIELRPIIPPPLSNVKRLNYKIDNTIMRFAISRVLDGLLWISPHAETISIEYDSRKSTFRFQYKEQPIYQGEIACCCRTLPISCWLRCIKEIKIEEVHRNRETKCFTVKKEFLKKIDDICDRLEFDADRNFSRTKYIVCE